MKRYARIVQCDKRGQIVIPKDLRDELKIVEGTGFYMYSIENEGILLKIVPDQELTEQSVIMQDLKTNSEKIKLDKKNLDKTLQRYRKMPKGKLREV